MLTTNKKAKFPKLAALLLLTAMLQVASARAGSATWDVNPTTDWNTAKNWTPETVPNSPNDIATFAGSNVFDPVIHSDVEINEINFAEQADSFTITVGDAAGGEVAALTISGFGVVNNVYPTLQTIQAAPTLATNGTTNLVIMKNNAILAGVQGGIDLVANGGQSAGFVGGQVQFLDNSTANPPDGFGGATAHAGLNGGGAGTVYFLDNSSAGNGDLGTLASGAGSTPGMIIFEGTSTAAASYIGNFGATAAGIEGGKTFFLGSSTAGEANVTALGGFFEAGAGGGTITFSDQASAAGALLEVESASGNRGDPASIVFLADSTGGTAQVRMERDGKLDIAQHNPPGITIGSLDGKGSVVLGSNALTIGSNDLTTRFVGPIKGRGSLTKIGVGTLSLDGRSKYTGGTTVNGGTLSAINDSGSATGTGEVNILAGTLGGSGIIVGPVTVGTGSGSGAFLSPSLTSAGPTPRKLTIQSLLTFQADGIYICNIRTTTKAADQVVANGVTILQGAQCNLVAGDNRKLTVGDVFKVVSNTSAGPISGTFSNLADGAIVTVGSNNFQANYKGGDGNDLTFTVVP